MPDPDEAKPQYLRRNHYVTLEQAANEAPVLSRLLKQVRQSQTMLEQISGLIPPALRNSVQPGALDGQEWCLIVPNSAAAAKLRQLAPALTAHLRVKGHDIQSLRLRIVRS